MTAALNKIKSRTRYDLQTLRVCVQYTTTDLPVTKSCVLIHIN
jgi:hypothetical protein